MSTVEASASSYRDPDGFIFRQDGRLYRQINPTGVGAFRLMQSSGLLQRLVADGLIVDVREVDSRGDGSLILEPETVPLISYPWEWSFGQLKDAALTTLRVAEIALECGMALKDATALNIQFLRGRPIHIDTLSFEPYREGAPWVAYRQFCEHFLCPLALMAFVDERLSSLLRSNLEGIPLDLASNLLPTKTKLNMGLAAHIHAHAKATLNTSSGSGGAAKMPLNALKGLLMNLRSVIESLKWEPSGTTWSNYYSETNYSDSAMASKKQLVTEWLDKISPKGQCWDLGANDGTFSRIAAKVGFQTTAWDIDPAAVELAYRWARNNKEENLLPLLQDLANPTPAQGWAGRERESFFERGQADVILALALIHHLAIGRNVPLPMIAETFSRLGEVAIVEFVPKDDSQVQRMLANRQDVFSHYNQASFEDAFNAHFRMAESQVIEGTSRRLYLWKKR